MGIYHLLLCTLITFDTQRFALWLETVILYIKSAIERKIIIIGFSLWRNIYTLQNKL